MRFGGDLYTVLPIALFHSRRFRMDITMTNRQRTLEDILLAIDTSIASSHGVSSAALRCMSQTQLTLLHRRYPLPSALSDQGSLRLELISSLEALLRQFRIEGYYLPEQDPNGDAPDAFIFGPIRSPADYIARKVIETVALFGPEKTAQLLRDYCSGSEFTCRCHFVLSGATVNYPVTIDSGISIGRLSGDRNDIEAALPDLRYFPYSRKPRWSTEAILSFDSGQYPRIFHEHASTFISLALSVVADQSICCVLRWEDFGYSDGVNLEFGGVSNRFDMWQESIVSLSQSEVKGGVELYLMKFHDWDESTDLGRAVRKWWDSKHSKNLVDCCRDLRVALELALSVSGNKRTHKVSTRGARYLTESDTDKERVEKQLRDAYSLCSDAVHTAKVEKTYQNLRLVADAQTLCRDVIIKRLHSDLEPKWS